ncbi:xanthine dehydrogenase accessory protein XdhC [Labrys miyagiensis]|uniref:Xanthine dehydrogenase accessory protein XdhC n=1 Tax=Labrys miyagiensis TaxID=346912 RepID=A0ABQ6CP77_9HYPH|nr:xanthine dehydrogenase accessory protein XdhC [Labrys miyagiensis]GLS20504.1 xanthine dehydrogenase accessory protein XdhC [Labrys miyagiensis]
MTIFDTLKAMIERDGRAVLVTITAVRGSSPREAGTRMAVRADGAFSGTIGGGALEWQALAEAQALLSGGSSRMRTLDKALGPDLGQCCGGRVKLMLERLERDDLSWLAGLVEPPAAGGRVVIGMPQPHGTYLRCWADAAEAALLPEGESERLLPDGRLVESLGPQNPAVYLFGAGHVGRALILALAPLPLDLVWCDPRPEAFPSHVPQRVILRREAEPERILASAPDDARILIMTHSHALDLAIASAALAAARFAYIGVIGSGTKRARFVSQMRQAGLTQAAIDSMVCPVGIPGIEGKEPAVIAASVVAQILLVESKRAALAPAQPRKAPVPHRSVGEKPLRNV